MIWNFQNHKSGMWIIPNSFFFLLNEQGNFPTNIKAKPIFQILNKKRASYY